MLLLPPPLIDRVHNMEALTLMRLLPAQSIDAVITDLPYQVTACSWDQIIPFAPMWTEVKRVLKPRGVFVTTASQPFTSALVMSNPSWFHQELIWDKALSTGFLDAKQKHLRQHENIIVFGLSSPSYYPQMRKGVYRIKGGRNRPAQQYGKFKDNISINDEYYPTTLLRYANTDRITSLHPTQKPVALYEYLIKTYTQPGELVLDFCAGSGTTALAARNTGRRFIAGDQSAEYCMIARDRLRLPFEPRERVKESAPMSDLPLFAAIGD